MSWYSQMLWLTLSALGLLGCGLLAGLETGVYSLNRVRLHLLAHRGQRSAQAIAELLAKPGALLATLLIGTNIATNLATSTMGLVIESRYPGPWQVIAITALIETPLLFVFAETLPKDLFAAHADRLVYPFAGLMLRLRRLFTIIGLLPLITLISNLLLRVVGGASRPVIFHPKLLVNSLVKEGVGYGLLSDEQSALVDRVFALGDRLVGDKMIPWPQVTKLSVDDGSEVIWNLAQRTSRSRFPVIDSGGQVVGVVNVYDALWHDRAQCPVIRQLMRPPLTMERRLPLREGLARLQKGTAGLAIVADHGRPVGIVTIKDLVEPITGELASW